MATGMNLQRKRKNATLKNGCVYFAIFVSLAQRIRPIKLLHWKDQEFLFLIIPNEKLSGQPNESYITIKVMVK